MKPEDPPVSIGGMLGREAQRREISHEAAADLIGVSQATFSRWVNDENLPTSAYWTKIARFLQVPRDRIVESAQSQRSTKRDLNERLAAVERGLDELTTLVEEALRRRR